MKKKKQPIFMSSFIPLLENPIVSQNLPSLRGYLPATAQLPLAEAMDL